MSEDAKSPETPVVLDGTPPPANWRRYARITLWVVVAVLVLVFLFSNSEIVRVSFVFFQVDVMLWIVLLAVLLIGAALGWSASWWMRRRKRRRDR